MKTFQLLENLRDIPAVTSWYVADLAEARGKQELFTKQSSQRLKVLRGHALIESALSSNRIEGVEVDKSRIGTLMFGTPTFQDRDEEEVSGYRDALKLIHQRRDTLPISAVTVKKLHKLSRGKIWDAGKYKDKDIDIIQTYPDGRTRVRFKSVSARQTPPAMANLMQLWQRGLRERWVHPFVLAAALNLDFLCIHPFRDGNGRVSRLLFLLACYHCGLEVGRYISIERLIEHNKERYYEVLEQSSQGWHAGKHDPWPTINFLLYTLTEACKEFEKRLGQMKSPRGEKTTLIETAIKHQSGEFSISDIQRACPGVSIDLIRKVLKRLRDNDIECVGRGPTAKWRRKRRKSGTR